VKIISSLHIFIVVAAVFYVQFITLVVLKNWWDCSCVFCPQLESLYLRWHQPL